MGLWILLWGGYNSGPWYFNDPRFPRDALELFHGLRAFLPLLAGWIALVLLLARGSLKLRLLGGPLGLTGFYAIVGLASSGTISKAPGEALYWGSAYMSVILILAVVLSSRDPMQDLSNLMLFNWIFDALILIALLAAIPILGNALTPTEGSPLGVKAYKEAQPVFGMAFTRNTGFARYAAVAGLVALAKIWRGRRLYRLAWGILLLVSMYALVLSQGRTEVAAFAAGAALILYLQKSRRIFYIVGGILGSTLLGLVGFFRSAWEYLTRTQKFDPTLTGRTTIWEEGWHLFLQSPWWGYGFQADRVYINGQHMHNVLLQALVQSGILGTVALILAILLVWYLVIKIYILHPPQDPSVLALEVPGILLYFTVSSIPESTFAFFGAVWMLGAPILAYVEYLGWQSAKLQSHKEVRLPYGAQLRILRARKLAKEQTRVTQHRL